jgi:hypothetical protein
MASEAVVQQQARLLLASMRALPMRNNVGVAVDETGRHIRYGLMNESKQQNEQFKSSDLIAVIPIIITPSMVGRTVGILGAFECKPSNWVMPRPSNVAEYKRASAQARFHDIVRGVGGVAGFVTSDADIYRIIYASQG